ncbi:MAG: hypothetical protein WAV46_04505 [Candidatus Moraniibacteriota bacterium]
MKIYVIGSTTFVKEMVATVNKLKQVGHDGWIHPHYIDYVEQKNHPHLKMRENGEHSKVKIEHDYIRQHYKHILESDAVFVVNMEKNGIKNYIGGNVLIELGQAYVCNKVIYLLNPIPDMPYTEEIVALQPIVINGDFETMRK